TIDINYNDLKDEDLKLIPSEDLAISLYNLGQVALRQPIFVMVDGKLERTTAGRIIFNQTLPQDLRFINNEVKAGDIKSLVVEAMKTHENEEVGKLIDRMKEVGFWAATISAGQSLSVFDCKII